MPFKLPSISGLVTDGIKGLADSAKGIIESLTADPSEKLLAQQKLLEETNRHTEAITAQANEIEKSYLEDVQSARNMQVEALKQDDKFSKRFTEYFAIGITLCVIAFDFSLFFVNFPEQNKDMINFAAGILNSTALVSILSFFYGSSKSSAVKNDIIKNMTQQ